MSDSRRLIPRNIISKRNAAIILFCLLGALIFFSIFDAVQEQDDFARFDAPLSAWATANQHPTLIKIMYLITDASSPVALGVVTLVGASLWAWRKKELWRPALLVGAMTLAFIVSSAIKVATARARPSVTELINSIGAVSYSFPSGHTIGAAVFLLVLGYFFCSAKPTMRRIITWVTIIISGIVLVAFSRIYLGYHWLTDVSASVGLALLITALVIAADTYRPGRKKTTTSSTEDL